MSAQIREVIFLISHLIICEIYINIVLDKLFQFYFQDVLAVMSLTFLWLLHL